MLDKRKKKDVVFFRQCNIKRICYFLIDYYLQVCIYRDEDDFIFFIVDIIKLYVFFVKVKYYYK